ncbi:hypothetical protein D3C87_1027720 [compost metagenome]
MTPTETRFSAASRTGSLSLPSLDEAAKAVDAALSPVVSDPLQRRLTFLPSPGVPVRLETGNASVEIFWPYAPGSRNGGPEQLASAGASQSFRDHLAPFAAYFGAGTRGAMMAWLGDQASRGELPTGSAATQGLQAIANTLFWDVPMFQASDDRLIARGMPVDLSAPEAMGQYLRHQRDAIAGLVSRQDPETDGPAYMRAGRELLAMIDAALRRVEGYGEGDRQPVSATPLGPYGWYNQASEPAEASPLDAALDAAATPAELRQLAIRLEEDAFSLR